LECFTNVLGERCEIGGFVKWEFFLRNEGFVELEIVGWRPRPNLADMLR
jgi:hypothetical protein